MLSDHDCAICEDEALKDDPNGWLKRRFIVCKDCGNKRCPRASWHMNFCSGSNEVGQKGSFYGPEEFWPKRPKVRTPNEGTAKGGDLSLDIWLTQEVDYGGPDGPERVEHFSANITHNLGRMWQFAGVYDALYESAGKTAADILPALEVGVDFMFENEAACRKHDAPNGWGLYEHALPWLQKLVAACRRYPRAEIGVSR